MKRFVILDRDGTVNREAHYLSSAEQVELYSGVGDGLRQMQEMGLGLVVLTNQSGIARGYFSLEDLEAIHARLRELLAAYDVELDGMFFCPHRPEDNCTCRKPLTGMVKQASALFGFDPAKAFLVGDKPCDIILGRAVGATTLLVRTGYGEEFAKSNEITPDYTVDDLVQAAHIIQRLLEAQVERTI